MRATRQRNAASGRSAFTLIEIMIASLLMSILAMFVASAWHGLGRSMTDGVARARIAQEANLALESLNRDLSGVLPGNLSGYQHAGKLLGHLAVGSSQLLLCFEGTPANQIADWAAPDTVIMYSVQNGQLLRSNQLTGTQFVVADQVTAMQVTGLASGVRVELTFSYRNLTKTFYIVSHDP